MPFTYELTGPRGVPFTSQLGAPITPQEAEEQAVSLGAYGDTPLAQGFERGRRGLSSGYKNWMGSILEARGSHAADEYYGAAEREAKLGGLASPDLKPWEHVHGPGDVANYVAGQAGQFAPVMAPSLVGSGLATALRYAPATRMAAGMLPLHPMMAGSVTERQRADPLTRALPPGQRFREAQLEGLGAAALYAAPGMMMQSRAAGLIPAIRSPLGRWSALGNVAAETGTSAASMGAGSLAAGELGRVVQRSHDPGYMRDPEELSRARTEEFAGGAAGMLPIAVPHAVMAHTIGASMKPGERLLKKTADAVVEGARTVGGKAAEFAKSTAEKGFGLASEGADKAAPVFGDARRAAEAAYDEKADAGAPRFDAHMAALAAATKTLSAAGTGAVKEGAEKLAVRAKAIADTAEAKSTVRRIRSAALAVDNYFGQHGDPLATPESVDAATKAAAAKLDAVVSEAVNVHADKVHTDAVQEYSKAKLDNDPAAMAEAARKISSSIDKNTTHLGTMLDEKASEAKTSEDIPESRQSVKDPANYAVANALRGAKIGKDVIADAVRTVQVKTLVRDGVNITMQRVHDALVKNGVLKPDDNWGRRTPLYAEISSALKAVLEEHSPDTAHDVGTEHLKGPFTEVISERVKDLYARHPIKGVDTDRVTGGVVDFIDNLANNKRELYSERARAFATDMIGRYGEDGKAFLADVVDDAKARWGEESEQYKRVAGLREGAGRASDAAAKLAPMLHESVLKGESAESVLARMSHDYAGMEERYAGTPGRIKELRQTLRELEAQPVDTYKLSEKRAEEQRQARAKELFDLRRELTRLERETGRAPEEAFREAYDRVLHHKAKAEDVLKLVRDYRGDKQKLAKPDTTRKQGKAPEVRLPGEEKVEGQEAAEQAEAGDKPTREEAGQGTQGEVEAGPTFIGVESAFNNAAFAKREGALTVEPPINRHPSDDYPQGRGQYTAAMQEATATHAGHRVAAARWVSMDAWAKEAATQHGKPYTQLLTEAMDASLAVDKQRLAAAQKAGRSSETLRQYIERRKAVAETLKTNIAKLTGKQRERAEERLGRDFWEDAANTNYGYIRAEKATGANLVINAEHLEGVYGPHKGESSASYAVQQARREAKTLHGPNGETITQPRKTKIVEQSLIPIAMTDGTKTVADLPKIVSSLLREHQAGDITGAGDAKQIPPAERATKVPEDVFNVASRERVHTQEEIKTAVLNTLTTLADTKGVEGKSVWAGLKPDTIVYRGPEGLVVWKMIERGRKVPMVTEKGTLAMRSYHLHEDVLPKFAPETTRSAKPVEAADAAAREGMLHGALTKGGKTYDLNAKELLRHMLELNRMDPDVALDAKRGISDALAAQLLREGIKMLSDEGYKLNDRAQKPGFVPKTVEQIEHAWDAATVYRTQYGDQRPTPVTFKKLMDIPVRKDTVPRDIQGSRTLEAKEELHTALAEVERLADDAKRGVFSTRPEDDLALARERAGEKSVREEFATSTREDDTAPLKHSVEEMENARMGQIIDDLKRMSDEPNLFDQATQRIVSNLADTFGKLIAEKREAGEWNRDLARTGMYLSPMERAEAEKARYGKGLPTEPGLKTPVNAVRSEGKSKEGMAPPAGAPMGLPAEHPEVVQKRADEAQARIDKLVANVHDISEKIKAIFKEKAMHDEFTAFSETPDSDVLGPERSAFREKDVERIPEPLLSKEAPQAPEVPASVVMKQHAERAAAENMKHREAAENARDRLLRLIDARKVQVDARMVQLLRNTNHLETIRKIAKIEAALKAKDITPVEAVKELQQTMQPEEPAPVKPEKPKAPPSSDDVPFSRQTIDGMGELPPNLHGSLYKIMSSMLPKEIADKLTVSKDMPADVAGQMNAAAREILINAFVGDRHGGKYGVLNHEVWHGVEKALRTLGKEGEHILETIYRHVDTPAMRAALEAHYGDDARIVEQLREAKPSERAAFAFQAFRNGVTFELAPQTRNIFARFANWIKETLGFTSDKTKSDAFFKYLEEGGLVSDFKNPQAVLRGLAETRADRYTAKIRDVVRPVTEGLGVALKYTSQRVREMDNPHFNSLLEAFEGPSGKGGYQNALNQMTNEYVNQITQLMHGKTEAERRTLLGGATMQRLIGNLEREAANRLIKAEMDANPKLTRKEADAIAKNITDRALSNTFAANQDRINDHMDEFVNDLMNHGGLDFAKGDIGKARDVTQSILENGMHYDPEVGHKLFAGNDAMQKKWGDTSVDHELSQAVRNLTRIATRAEFFGKDIGGEYRNAKIKEWMDRGSAAGATAAQVSTMHKVLDAFEGRLGADMTPGQKKVVSAIMVANNIRLLPLAIFTQFLDATQLGLRSNEYGAMVNGLMSGIAELPRSFNRFDAMYDVPWRKRFAEQIGATADRHLGSVLSGVHTGYQMTGRAGKLNDAFFKWTLQEQWNRSMHEIAAENAVHFLHDHYNMKSDISKRYMKELGLERGDVKFAKSGDSTTINADSTKVKRAINQFTREAVALPDVGSNPLWMNDPRWALLAQLKKFQFAHSRYVLGRAANEWKMGNAQLPLMLLPMSMGVSYAAEQVKYGVFGGMPDIMNKWTFTDWISHEVSRTAAGRWNFGDDFINAIEHGASPVESLGGPTVEGAGRIAHAFHVDKGSILGTLLGPSQSTAIQMPDS